MSIECAICERDARSGHAEDCPRNRRAAEFYIVSVKHSHRQHRYITFWKADDRGYCFRLSIAGKYSRDRVMAHLGYYNSGDNIAVPVDLVESIITMTTPADRLDGPDGPAVLNDRANWRKLIAAVIAKPEYPVRPAKTHFGRNDPYRSPKSTGRAA